MEKQEGYTGENTKWIEFNKKILITRDDGTPYMYRNTLLSIGKWLSIKYHRIVASDDICDHDHPWPFVSLIVKGGYYEWTPIAQDESGEILDKQYGPDDVLEVKRWHGAGSLLYRHKNWRHRLELKDNKPCETLVITGKVCKRWGFFTKFGWIHWTEYSKQEHC